MGEPNATSSQGQPLTDVALAPSAATNEAERRALAIAQEFFPGPAHIEDAYDPEDPTWHRRAIFVTASGTPKELAQREMQYAERLIAELGSSADMLLLDLRFGSAPALQVIASSHLAAPLAER